MGWPDKIKSHDMVCLYTSSVGERMSVGIKKREYEHCVAMTTGEKRK